MTKLAKVPDNQNISPRRKGERGTSSLKRAGIWVAAQMPGTLAREVRKAEIRARAEAIVNERASQVEEKSVIQLPEGKVSTSETLNSRADEGLIGLLRIMEELGIPLAKSGIYLPDSNGGPYRHTQVTPEKMLELRRSAEMIRHLIRKNKMEGDILEKVEEGLKSDDPIIRRGATNVLIEIVLDEELFKDIQSSSDQEDGRENAIELLIESSDEIEECEEALEELGYSKKSIEEMTAKPDKILSLSFWKPRKGVLARTALYSGMAGLGSIFAFAIGTELGIAFLALGPVAGLMEGPCGKIKSRIKRKLGLDKKDRRLFLLTPTLAKIDEFKLIPRHGSADSSLEEVTDETRAMKDEMDRSAAGEGSESVKAKLELVRNEEKD